MGGIMRPRDLKGLGVPMDYLWLLHRRGLLDRIGRGMYALRDIEPTEHHSLAEACKRVPHGVICLLSALRFHGLTTQAPFEVWLAIDFRARLPRPDNLPLRIRAVLWKGAQRGSRGTPHRRGACKGL